LIRDIAILVYSRGREDLLTRLVDDMDRFYRPALEAGGMSACTFIYAQNYPRAYLDGLRQRFAPAIAAGRLIVFEASRSHSCIGEVFTSAAEAFIAQSPRLMPICARPRVIFWNMAIAPIRSSWGKAENSNIGRLSTPKGLLCPSRRRCSG
jgi:hypothetical protein